MRWRRGGIKREIGKEEKEQDVTSLVLIKVCEEEGRREDDALWVCGGSSHGRLCGYIYKRS